MDKTETILETITPEMALNWLSARPDFQRKVDEKQVRKLAHAIRKNEWRENGATIVFDEKGNLLDGVYLFVFGCVKYIKKILKRQVNFLLV